MNSDDLLDANLRLAETPEFELSDTDRLGLFVVSRLAQRQNVRVSLQPSPYGGTTAIVFLPAALLTEAPETQGTGFRLDRQNLTAENGRGRADGRLASLSQVPTGLTGNRSVLDGPIELEPPLTGREFEERPVAADSVDAVSDLGSADLDDTESERGGIFRAREHLRDSGRGTRGRETGMPRGPGIEDLHEQHRQAADHDGPQGREGRGAEPLGFPEQLPAAAARPRSWSPTTDGAWTSGAEPTRRPSPHRTHPRRPRPPRRRRRPASRRPARRPPSRPRPRPLRPPAS